MKPKRIQLSRKKGWRMPENTMKVDRSTRWGNPFKVGEVIPKGPIYSGRDHVVRDAKDACRLFAAWLMNRRDAINLIYPLRGKNLACWCPLDDEWCHADVLLDLANDEPE